MTNKTNPSNDNRTDLDACCHFLTSAAPKRDSRLPEGWAVNRAPQVAVPFIGTPWVPPQR